ncbi:MAG: cytochrome c1 [Alphaproteobacteria bacterium]|nr:cytochrome c1 [Alphaproteobacteria bacterium]
MRKLILASAVALAALAPVAGHAAGGDSIFPMPPVKWSFSGPFGTYDRAAAQRGFQVFKEVCTACHSLSLVAYRNLTELGLTENQVKAIAAEYQVPDLNDEGQPIERPARLSDRFKKPFANDAAAAAANQGKAPPDLSLIVKARAGGADYTYALLVGYADYAKLSAEDKAKLDKQVQKASGDPKAKFEVTKDENFNKYFPGYKISMAAPLAADKVTYVDGTKATLEQLSADVTHFLAWASEPKLEDRKRTGVRVLLFLLVLTGLMYAVKRQVWADKH